MLKKSGRIVIVTDLTLEQVVNEVRYYEIIPFHMLEKILITAYGERYTVQLYYLSFE